MTEQRLRSWKVLIVGVACLSATARAQSEAELSTSEYCAARFTSAFQRHSGVEEVPTVAPQAPRSVSVEQSKEQWSVTVPLVSNAKVAWPQALKTAKDLACRSEGKLRSRVALVPDPIDSGLGSQFYATMHGLQVGMETQVGDEALLRDESWLAWDDRRVAEATRKRSEDCRSSVPSVVLFRDSSEQLLDALFLVGESPVTGPHRAALDKALQAAETFRGGCHKEETSELPAVSVVGPAFSGGALTLRAAVDASGLQNVEVRSGTASALHLPEAFVGSHAHFSRTTPAEPDLRCALFEYVRSVASPYRSAAAIGRSIAVLTESSTAFGQSNVVAPNGGAPDGGDARSADCAFEPGLTIQFPVGIAATLRNEYEQDGEEASAKPSLGRRTTLDLSLRDEHLALDLESNPVARVIEARDLSLSRALAALARLSIQYVAIQATDIADAMFIARKVQDVVPDVRIAFFEASAVLTHPRYRSMLEGSLVVSAYPWLGASELSERQLTPLGVYETESVLGVSNAVLSLRGVPASQLRDVSVLDGAGMLPVLVSALGRGAIVPLRAHRRVYGTVVGDDAPHEAAPTPAVASIDDRVEPPRLWQVLFLFFVLVALFDWLRQAREQMRLELHQGCGDPQLRGAVRGSVIPSHDHDWDLAALRVKALGLHAVRSCLLAIVLSYMLCISWLAREVLAQDVTGRLIAAVLATAFCWLLSGLRGLQLLHEALAFGAYVPRAKGDAPNPLVKSVVSGQRMGMLVGLSCLIGLLAAVVLHVVESAPGVYTALGAALRGTFIARAFALSDTDLQPLHSQALLFVMRTTELGSGVSGFVPLAFAACCAYVHCVGRCARLQTAYALASISPDDGVTDGVSTPLTALLYPMHRVSVDQAREDRRAGLLADEVHLVNAVAHPGSLSRRRWLAVLIAIAPLIFTLLLKRPSALGSRYETLLLLVSLVACCALTLLVLLYLFDYWRALEGVLKRIMEHPIGHSFRRVHPFARDALPDMVSRDPDETLRMAACAQIAATLVATRPEWLETPSCDPGAKLESLQLQRSRALRRPSNAWSGLWGLGVLVTSDLRRVRSLRGLWRLIWALFRKSNVDAGTRPETDAPALEHDPRTVASLGYHTLTFACRGMMLLEDAWEPGPARAPGNGEPKRAPGASRGAWAASHERHSAEQLAWLRGLERYVATVIALVIGRYVRQYKHFVYVTTSCTALLMCAVASYAFEPQRVLMTCIWLLMAAVVSFTVIVYIGLDRNTLLSHISGSRPNKVTLSGAVLLRAGVWVLLPVLSVIAAQYPEFANGAYAIFQPIMRLVR